MDKPKDSDASQKPPAASQETRTNNTWNSETQNKTEKTWESHESSQKVESAEKLQTARLEYEPRASEAQRREEARALYEKASAAEPGVTKDMTAIAEKTGGTQQGLEHALKKVDSLSRKLEEDAPDKIQDSLRYTISFPPDKLSEGANASMKEMENLGYEKLRVKNSFEPGAPYKGINTNFRSPDGQVFEMQYHTPHSFETKQITHPLYEESRLRTTSLAEKEILRDKMIAISDNVEIPRDVDRIKKYP